MNMAVSFIEVIDIISPICLRSGLLRPAGSSLMPADHSSHSQPRFILAFARHPPQSTPLAQNAVLPPLGSREFVFYLASRRLRTAPARKYNPFRQHPRGAT